MASAPPQQLFTGRGATGETYWKAANGIRLTGMPAFRDSLTEQQMRRIRLLLAGADKPADSVMKRLAEPCR